MARAKSFRVGKVTGYHRNHVWYLCYHENGKRLRPRVGPDREAARQLAAQINGQIATGAPSALGFESITLPDLRSRWLEHHEQVLRSSVHSIDRYRTATDHLLRFLAVRPVRHAALFQAGHAEEFVRYLRALKVSSNGHNNTVKRPLLDKGVRYVLEVCRSMFNFAVKRRHLPPYSENPFTVLEIDRIPVETARRVELMDATREGDFLRACDEWQFPLFLTLLLTGLRPGELCHLLLPDDLDLQAGVLRVRNKPRLGWQVKTRNQRDIPLVPELRAALEDHLAGRTSGPVFRRRACRDKAVPLESKTNAQIESEIARRAAELEAGSSTPPSRSTRLRLLRAVWRDLGAVREDRVRTEFMLITEKLGWAGMTAPKVLRHQFATALQEGRVDPLVRNLLMGHMS